jgi:DNA-binding CsgD family transcriptional regulator
MVGLDPDLLAMIYEAAAIPSQWPVVLGKLAGLVSAFGSGIISVDNAQSVRFITTDNYRHIYENVVENLKRYDNVRPQRSIARGYFGFLTDLDLCTVEELEADPLYTEGLYPYGLGWTMGAPIPSPSADLAFFDFARKRDDGPFGDAEKQILDTYRPHLARAALMATRLELQRAQATVSTLTVLGLPGAVVNRGGRVVAANPLFEKLAPRVAIGAFDSLSLNDSAQNALLRKGLQATGLDNVGSIPIGATEPDPALVVHLVPVQRTAQDVFIGASHIVLVTPVTAPAAPLTNLLAGLFDLTPAEAAVARGIAGGDSIPEFAKKNGVSPETVRTQLRAVFEKTGTRRQVDLVRLLAGTTPVRKLIT